MVTITLAGLTRCRGLDRAGGTQSSAGAHHHVPFADGFESTPPRNWHGRHSWNHDIGTAESAVPWRSKAWSLIIKLSFDSNM